MKLTNNKLEKLIMEVLTESAEEPTHEWDGFQFKFGAGIDLENYTAKRNIAFGLARATLAGKGRDAIVAKTFESIIHEDYLDDFLAKIKNDKAIPEKGDIKKLGPVEYDTATMTGHKDDVETASTGTSKSDLDAAKNKLINYVKQFGTIASGIFTPTDPASPDATDTSTINAALAVTLQFNNTAFDKLVAVITTAEKNKDPTALQKGKDDLKDYYDNFDPTTNTAANAKKPDYDDAMNASIPVDFKDTFNAKKSSKPAGVKVKIPKSDQFNYDIKSVPQELKSLILRLFGQELKAKGATSDTGILKSFAGIAESLLKENTNEIDWEDFEYILRDKEDTSKDSAGNTITTEKPLYRKAIIAIKQAQNVASGTDFEKALSKLAQDYGIDLSKPTPGAAAQATFSPDLADLYGHANRAKVPAYVVSLYGSLGLSNTKDVETRINVLNDATKKIIDTKGDIDKKKFSIGEILSITSVASNMARIAKLMDDKAAGWAFEGFLSQLVDGQGLGVGMGAADFRYGIPAGNIPADSLGSAKLMSSNTASQSATTLGDALEDGESMYYIFGKKLESNFQKGTATQSDIAAVALYFVELKRADGKNKGNPITYNSRKVLHSSSKNTDNIPSKTFGIKYGPVGSPNTYCKMLSNSPAFSITGQDPFGIIYFHEDLGDLDKFNAKAMETVSTQLPNLIKAMNEFRQRTTRYLSSGEISSGEKAADEYAELMNLINSVFEDKAEETGMSIGVEVSGTSLQRKATQVKQTDFSDLAESKLQTLDQLIAEAMRDIKRKRKK